MKKIMLYLFGLSSLLLLAGCESLIPPKPGDAAFAPVIPVDHPRPKPKNGSLYNPDYAMNLFETNRARRPGDILTILLVEKTDAAKKATTTQTKDNTVAISNPTILGKPVNFGNGRNFAFDINGSREFQGQGESKQNNKLEGSISVTVSKVLSNGNMVVQGEKWITLNRGNEYIRLTGIVRPADISPENTIRSDRIANARIAYSGTGQVADSNVMGWFTRFFWSVLFPI